MTGLAIVGGQDVVRGLGRRPQTGSSGMTGEAVLRGSLEYPTDVAALACHRAVQPDQVKSGGVVIECAGRRIGAQGSQREGEQHP